jgi:UPF0716 protein FxsA
MLFVVVMLTVVPLAELYLIFQVSARIGFLPTVAFTILTAVIGSALARVQALRVWADWSRSLERLELPAHSVLEGLLILVGGVLLLTPGFITDAMGFLLLIPWTRRLVLGPLKRAVDRYLARARGSKRFVIHTQRIRPPQPGDVVDTTYDTIEDEPRQLH